MNSYRGLVHPFNTFILKKGQFLHQLHQGFILALRFNHDIKGRCIRCNMTQKIKYGLNLYSIRMTTRVLFTLRAGYMDFGD